MSSAVTAASAATAARAVPATAAATAEAGDGEAGSARGARRSRWRPRPQSPMPAPCIVSCTMTDAVAEAHMRRNVAKADDAIADRARRRSRRRERAARSAPSRVHGSPVRPTAGVRARCRGRRATARRSMSAARSAREDGHCRRNADRCGNGNGPRHRRSDDAARDALRSRPRQRSDRDAQLPGAVHEILGDARTGEREHALRQEVQQFLVAAERGGASVGDPSPACRRPGGRRCCSAQRAAMLLDAGTAAVDEHHVGVLGASSASRHARSPRPGRRRPCRRRWRRGCPGADARRVLRSCRARVKSRASMAGGGQRAGLARRGCRASGRQTCRRSRRDTVRRRRRAWCSKASRRWVRHCARWVVISSSSDLISVPSWARLEVAEFGASACRRRGRGGWTWAVEAC